MPTPSRSRFDVHLPPARPSSASSANSSLRFYAVESDRCSPACGNCEKALDASTHPLIRAQSQRCHWAAVEVSRRRQSCQRKVHHSQPLADQPRQTASIGPLSARKSCAAAFSCNAAFRYSQLADCATWPSGFPPGGAPGVQFPFRRFNPRCRLMSRFREHRIPHAVRPLSSPTVFVGFPHLPASLL
jgi:hypothetical protein